MSEESKYISGISQILSKSFASASERDRKFLIYGSVIAGAILAYFFIIEPAYIHNTELKKEIASVAKRVQRYKSVVDSSSESSMRNTLLSSKFNMMVARCFDGQTSDIAAGKLIALTRNIATTAGLTITSTKVEKVDRLKGFERVNIKVSFGGTLSQLTVFMRNIENNEKAVIIREAKINSLKESYPDDKPETLSVRLLLSGLRYLP